MRYACPCCGYKTLPEPASGTYKICPVCYWEDDYVQLNDPDFDYGANPVSLREAQKNFAEFGACEPGMIPHVRTAAKDENRDDTWKILD